MMVVGADVLRKYLIIHTKYEDYDGLNRSVYLYALGKDTLLSGDANKAIGYLNGIQMASPIWPYALQLRGTAYAILGMNSDALQDFKTCAAKSNRVVSASDKDPDQKKQLEREADDLESRCIAGRARTLYQMNEFEDADRVYDQIAKKSFVWPDILFEQAWNSFAKADYNRSLGKLVTYKSPALKFVFNTEVEVLRAQSFLALCLYSDANEVVNEFNKKYTAVGIEVKEYVEHNSDNLPAFYDIGKNALKTSLYTSNEFYRLMNRFVRGPYFQGMVTNERRIAREVEAIRRFDASQRGVQHDLAQGFPGFLDEVLRWRMKTIQLLGGAFVKNSLMDYHKALIDDFEKMAFIKLEMLKRSKDSLLSAVASKKEGREGEDTRSRGSATPYRRDDQYRWNFNGEFWSDELGDYVFGLESECKS
jgi:tetratricopeptide (TPR) repeat protein